MADYFKPEILTNQDVPEHKKLMTSVCLMKSTYRQIELIKNNNEGLHYASRARIIEVAVENYCKKLMESRNNDGIARNQKVI